MSVQVRVWLRRITFRFLVDWRIQRAPSEMMIPSLIRSSNMRLCRFVMKRRTITRLIKFTHNVLLLTFIYYCVYRPINARVCASGVRTTHAKGDADCLIVWEALQAAGLSPTVVVGEDTDLAVLLLYHCKAEHDIYLTSGSQTKPKVFSIKEGQDKVGKYVCEHILFAHTVSGCDTVPQPFNISKTLPIKRLEKGDRPFCDAAQVFLDPNSNSQDVVTSGEKAFVRMYVGRLKTHLIYCGLSGIIKN